MIPYGKQWIDDDDIQSVIDILKSDWLTTGPKVDEFETAFSKFTESKYSIAVNSGTAALHCAMYAIDIKAGDEVIVPTMTFAATANSVLYQNGIPVFVDVDPNTLLIDTNDIEKRITTKTKAIIAVDYAGQPVDYDRLQNIANKNNLILISDSCHAIGAEYKGRSLGSIADISTFSFHPVKNMTTGEGGMITTNNKIYMKRIRSFRNHGISTDHRERAEQGSWFYEMNDLGYNYRITDFQCALGISQLNKLPDWIDRRNKIAKIYNDALNLHDYIEPLKVDVNNVHAYHLYVVKIDFKNLIIDRSELFLKLRESGIGVNVHYIPVHLHPYYKKILMTKAGMFKHAEDAYEQIISLPIFPRMTDHEVEIVISTLTEIIDKSKL